MLSTSGDANALDPLVAIIQESGENVEEMQPDGQGGESSSNNASAKSRQRESYTIRDKLAMVRKFQNFDPPVSMRKFSLQYGIPPNTFKQWVRLYESNNIPEELATIESQSRRRIRPGKFLKVEAKILEFFKGRDPSTAEGRVDVQNLRELIDQWCKECLSEEEQESFKVTPSWLQRLLRRNSITDVEGVDVVVANGAFSEMEAPMLQNASTVPNEQDIQIIADKFIGKKRLRQPLETESQSTEPSSRRPRAPRTNTHRRSNSSNMRHSNGNSAAVHVLQVQEENPLELFAQMMPTHDDENPHPISSSSNSHAQQQQQQQQQHVNDTVHLHFGQVVISLNTIAQYCHQMNQPQLLEMTNQLSAYLQSTHAALGSVDNGLPAQVQQFHGHQQPGIPVNPLPQQQQQQQQQFTIYS